MPIPHDDYLQFETTINILLFGPHKHTSNFVARCQYGSVTDLSWARSRRDSSPFDTLKPSEQALLLFVVTQRRDLTTGPLLKLLKQHKICTTAVRVKHYTAYTKHERVLK